MEEVDNEYLKELYNSRNYPPVGQYNKYIESTSRNVERAILGTGIVGGIMLSGVLSTIVPLIGTGSGAAAITSGLATLGCGKMMGGIAVIGASGTGVVSAGAVCSNIIEPISNIFKIDLQNIDYTNINRLLECDSRGLDLPVGEYYDKGIIFYNCRCYVIEGQFISRQLTNIIKVTIVD